MSCRDLERLFVVGAPAADLDAHRKGCAECRAAGAADDPTTSAAADLQAPVWSPALRAALLEIPRMTVSCEGADALLARSLEGEIDDADEARLRYHLGRCAGCTAAAETLLSMRELESPAPPPWLTARIAASKPARKPPRWRMLLSGRAVVAYAYAAALAVMILGLNPTSVARKAGFARLSESTRAAVTVAQNSIGDRLGALNERAIRTVETWKGKIGGYGRAAFSNALAIVWRPEQKKSTNRPHLGREGDAESGPDVFFAVGTLRREPFDARFRV